MWAAARKRVEAEDASPAHATAAHARAKRRLRTAGRPARKTSRTPVETTAGGRSEGKAPGKQRAKEDAEAVELRKQGEAQQAAALSARQREEAALQRRQAEEAAARYTPVGAPAPGTGTTIRFQPQPRLPQHHQPRPRRPRPRSPETVQLKLHVKQKNVVTLASEPQDRRQSANFRGSK